jgi:type VI secretion system protein VasG
MKLPSVVKFFLENNMNAYLKSVISKLDASTRAAFDEAINEAATRNHSSVKPEHLLLAIIRRGSPLIESLGFQAGLEVSELTKDLITLINEYNEGGDRTPTLSPELVSWLVNSWLLASTQWDLSQLTSMSLLASIFDEYDEPLMAAKIVTHFIRHREKILMILNNGALSAADNASTSGLESTALAKYTRNLSTLALNDELDPVVGREPEIRQMIDILLRRRQNNPILTGEPGVGKTALAEGLALRIAAGTVPPALKSMQVLTLDLGLLQAGASVKGEFENRLQILLKEIASAPHPLILFIDEAHTLIGAGGQAGQNDAANLLKPALARGELRIIAATTWAEYKKYFEKDAALVRRFQLVQVKEPDIENATVMLRAMAPAMAKHHGVIVQESAIHAAVNLSSRYITGRQLPDKSISVLDTACARVAVSQAHVPRQIETVRVKLDAINQEILALEKESNASLRLSVLERQREAQNLALAPLKAEWKSQKLLVNQIIACEDGEEKSRLRSLLKISHEKHAMVFECVDAVCIADIISEWTSIPLGRMLEEEQQKINELSEHLAARVIAQPHALSLISRQIQISHAGMSDPQKPTGVYMLCGPSGTGKTETALALADLLLGGEQNLVTVNMSEYQEAHSVSGLKGSPPGYVGYGQGGVLTEAVRRNPYCVLLLDEVEKAHPDVMELFYQIFDKGLIEDSEGQTVNFRNTLIIMTSNLSSSILTQAIEEGVRDADQLCSLIRPEFERHFTPALMGRISLVPYLPLAQAALTQITALKLDKLCKRYQQRCETEAPPKYSKKLIKWVTQRCQIKQSGARDIDQVLNKEILPLLSRAVTEKNRHTFVIDITKDKPVLV